MTLDIVTFLAIGGFAVVVAGICLLGLIGNLNRRLTRIENYIYNKETSQ